MMPNTPALVQAGATVFARGSNTLPGDGELVQSLGSTFGICEEMAEKHMDAVTGLSASGPAFVSKLHWSHDESVFKMNFRILQSTDVTRDTLSVFCTSMTLSL